jgi:hypothetical protein
LGTQSKIKIISEPTNYFEELITQAAQDTKKSSPEGSVHYLASLLGNFIKTQSSTMNFGEIDGLTPTLALMKAKTLKASEQLSLYRKIGDFSLFISGMFINALSNRMLDINYYNDLGKKGYQLAHSITSQDSLREIFLDLSLNFISYIEILHRVSEQTGITNHSNLLNLYKQWVGTQSEFFEKLLRAHGFDVNQKTKLKT